MPHAELHYSAEIDLPCDTILSRIEEVISTYDTVSGQCKGRAFPVAVTHHRHIYVRLKLLAKPHRDAAFFQGLLETLDSALDPLIPKDCAFSFEVETFSPHYITRKAAS